MVRVCDTIMGSGKSSAAITFINEHPDEKFVYITPYLEEASRIRLACPRMNFAEPSNKLKEFSFTKSLHTAALISSGRNIATTHQAFRTYTAETLATIRSRGYILICDESVNVLQEVDIHPEDMRIAVDCGLIIRDDDAFRISEKPYDGCVFADTFRALRNKSFIAVNDGDTGSLFYWELPIELFMSFKDVFILTYLFEGQSLCHFLKIHKVPYQYIYVRHDPSGGYRFSGSPCELPEHTSGLGGKIRVLENDRMNGVGRGRTALSMNWYKHHAGDAAQLKRNLSNYFNNIHRDTDNRRKLWGTYSNEYRSLRGKGYTKSFLPFNARAMNGYRDRDCLAYLVNLYMSVSEKNLYAMQGVAVNEDLYALSVMVQWIWRSAIRNGRPVDLYLPSERMRHLLHSWIADLESGVRLNAS